MVRHSHRTPLTRSLALLSLLIAAALTACKFDKSVEPITQGGVAVYFVLNPAAGAEQLQLERVLVGRVEADTGLRFDPLNPIVTGGGIPIRDATIRLNNRDNEISGILRADSARLAEGEALGVFGLFNHVRDTLKLPADPPYFMLIQANSRYHLDVLTFTGEHVTGDVVIPDAPPTGNSVRDSIDITNDTLELRWRPARSTYRYALQITTPFGPATVFAADSSARLPGTLRNALAPHQPLVFYPGFLQPVVVAAVDRNFYDFYASRVDPIARHIPISHLQGGTGIFGAFVPFQQVLLEVRATPRLTWEGTYATSRPVIGGEESLVLFRLADSSDVTKLSGRYSAIDGPHGVLGTRHGASLQLVILRDWSAADTQVVVDGTIAGDSIVGVVRGGGTEPVTLRKNSP